MKQYENKVYHTANLRACSVDPDTVPASKHGCSRNSNTWAKGTLNLFNESGDDCWLIEVTDRGPVRNIKDAESAAARLRHAIKRGKYKASAFSRLDKVYLMRINVEEQAWVSQY